MTCPNTGQISSGRERLTAPLMPHSWPCHHCAKSHNSSTTLFVSYSLRLILHFPTDPPNCVVPWTAGTAPSRPQTSQRGAGLLLRTLLAYIAGKLASWQVVLTCGGAASVSRNLDPLKHGRGLSRRPWGVFVVWSRPRSAMRCLGRQ